MKSAIAAFVAAAAPSSARTGKPDGLDQPSHHGRRRRPQHQRHQGRAGLAQGKGRAPRPLHCRRADLRGALGRHDQDRPARHHADQARRARRAGPHGLSAERAQSDSHSGGARRRGSPSEPLDSGTPHFDPSTLVFTTFDVGNPASNVSPAEARAACNIRFNDLHTPASLQQRVESVASEVAQRHGRRNRRRGDDGRRRVSHQAGPFITLVSDAIARVTNMTPEFRPPAAPRMRASSRIIVPWRKWDCRAATMHKVDECAPVEEINRLTDIYAAVLESYFAKKLA